MKRIELQQDIANLENLFKSRLEDFDKALKKNMNLDEVRKLFHELRILSSRLDEFRGAKRTDRTDLQNGQRFL